MKIARRKRAQAGTGCFNPGDAKSASRTGLNSSFQRAIFGRAQRRLYHLLAKDRRNPVQKAAEKVLPFSSASIRLPEAYRSTFWAALSTSSGSGVTAVTVFMTVLLSAQSKGDFRPRKTLSKSMIYITDRHPCQDLLHYNR